MLCLICAQQRIRNTEFVNSDSWVLFLFDRKENDFHGITLYNLVQNVIYTLHRFVIFSPINSFISKQKRDSFKILKICLWIICAKFHNNLTKDEKVMVKCFDFGQELREKQTDKLSYGGAQDFNRENYLQIKQKEQIDRYRLCA